MKFLNLLTLLALISCANIRSVSQTSIPAKKGKLIKAEVTKNIIFFFNFNTDYVNDLNQKLLDQCKDGSVTGILTKDVTVTYFPIIWHQDQISAEGYCNE